MSQPSLFAVQLVDEIDSPFGGRDSGALGIDISDNEYLLKRLQDGPLLPITEWVCYHLCRMAGIPSPEFSVVLRPNGEPAFGSKIDNNVLDFNRRALSIAEQTAIIQSARASESATLALDAILPNPDRHFGNWLYAARRGKFVALAIDWSRCDALRSPPFGRWPWPPECNSASIARTLQTFEALDADALRRTGQALNTIAAEDLRAILQSAPELWRSSLDESAILSWWSASLHQRTHDSEGLILP